MLIKIDVVNRKKLVLVKQMYQRALNQSFTRHNSVSRIFSVIGFDLANETVLKTLVSALNPVKNLSNDFQGILKQAEDELTAKNLTIPDKVKIQHVRALRNDAQHKAKYPSETDVNDCRTYTRDFLAQTFQDVWGESFDSFSLIDAVQNPNVLEILKNAEKDLINSDFQNSVAKAKIAFQSVIGKVADLITGEVNSSIDSIMVTNSSQTPSSNRSLLKAFMKARKLIAYQVVGINSQDYLRFRKYTNFISVFTPIKGDYQTRTSGKTPTKEEVEYVLNFVTESVIQIEQLDSEILGANHE